MSTPADVYGGLWPRYDDNVFEESVALFSRRFEANGFDLSWFKGKLCLDAGCGGGRYSIAMNRLGAMVRGIDTSEASLADACRRQAKEPAHELPIYFNQKSVLDLPDYWTGDFDFACCSGVLHHTADPEKGLKELARVLKPGGKLYLLLYGTGGVRWSLVCKLRGLAQKAGFDQLDRAMREVELPANRQRTFLDDLFVPLLGFFDWEALEWLLKAAGFSQIERWEKGKLDHEENFETQFQELEDLGRVFDAAGLKEAVPAVESHLAALEGYHSRLAAGDIGPAEFRELVWGEGNHRVLAVKS